MKASRKGAFVAVAVASLFATGIALAGTGAEGDANAKEAKVKCAGINACKGQGACNQAGHSCAGMNECKGKGWIETSAADCKAKGGKPL